MNGEIRLKIRVVPIDEKMRENRLKWFSHVQMRVINALLRKNEFIQVERIKKGRGRLKITLVETVKKGPVNEGSNRESIADSPKNLGLMLRCCCYIKSLHGWSLEPPRDGWKDFSSNLVWRALWRPLVIFLI